MWAKPRVGSKIKPRPTDRSAAAGSGSPQRSLPNPLHPGWRRWRTRCTCSPEPTTTPATMSLWPFKYLVALWTTTSKPISRGRKFTGLAKVLSITEIKPCSRAKSATARRCGTSIKGLEIVPLAVTRAASPPSRTQNVIPPVPPSRPARPAGDPSESPPRWRGSPGRTPTLPWGTIVRRRCIGRTGGLPWAVPYWRSS